METTENILRCADAMQYCLKSNNTEWYDRHKNRIIDILLGELPRGSGIDCEWKFDITDKTVFCKNSYHIMNDSGFYDGYIDFNIIIKTGYRTIDGVLDFTIQGKFGSKHQDIKDYLYDVVSYAIEKL